MVDADTP